MLLLSQLLAVAALFFVFIMGQVYGLYLSVWWWDIPSHLLGGLWAGFFAASFIPKRGRNVYAIAGTALLIGCIWEIFEYQVGIGGSAFMSYGADTFKDLCMDAIGGAAAFYILKYFRL